MTDTAFVFALMLGAIILAGMLWISHAASFRLTIRQRERAYAKKYAAWENAEEEPELDLGGDLGARPRSAREVTRLIREVAS